MALTIGLGVLGGRKLDAYFQNEKPMLTLVFSVLGLVVSLVVVIRSVSKKFEMEHPTNFYGCTSRICNLECIDV